MLVFYRSRGRWYERLISWATKGPFVHVAIQLEDGTLIAAETTGVQHEAFDPADEPFVQRLSLQPASSASAAISESWAKAKVGSRYGWTDIISQGFRLLGSPLYIGRLHSLDCSDLAACYAARYTNDPTLMSWVLDARQEISPNDLARYYRLS